MRYSFSFYVFVFCDSFRMTATRKRHFNIFKQKFMLSKNYFLSLIKKPTTKKKYDNK